MDLIIVYGESDDASVLLKKDDLSVIYIYDTYHGERPNIQVLESLGHNIISFFHSELVPEDKYEYVDTTNEVPNLDLIIDILKEKCYN